MMDISCSVCNTVELSGFNERATVIGGKVVNRSVVFRCDRGHEFVRDLDLLPGDESDSAFVFMRSPYDLFLDVYGTLVGR